MLDFDGMRQGELQPIVITHCILISAFQKGSAPVLALQCFDKMRQHDTCPMCSLQRSAQRARYVWCAEEGLAALGGDAVGRTSMTASAAVLLCAMTPASVAGSSPSVQLRR